MSNFKLVAVPFSAKGNPVGEHKSAPGRRHSDATVEAVREAHRNKGLGRCRLAELFGISTWTIQDWLRSHRRNTPAIRVKMRRIEVKDD